MAKLTEVNEAKRLMQSMLVLRLNSQGKTVEAACEEVGISKDQYYYWISTGDQVIESLRRDIAESERFRLIQVNYAYSALVNKLVQQISNNQITDPEIIIKVLKFLKPEMKDLETRRGIQVEENSTAEDYLMLNGPKTRVEDSQMEGQHDLSKTSINVKPRPDGSLDISVPKGSAFLEAYPEMADGEFTDIIREEEAK